MKNLYQNCIAIFCAIIVFASCKPVYKSQTADVDYLYFTKRGITQKPLITDLDVAKQKVTISKTYENLSLNDAKDAAMGDFIQDTKCDLIVQPYFLTTTTLSGNKTTINVTLLGYPANFKNIRNFELRDTTLLLNSSTNQHSSSKK